MRYETSSAGYEITFNGPDSTEEYDEKSEPGQCLKDAVANTIYRSTLPAWQTEFIKVLKERTGVQREVDVDATAKAKAKAKDPENAREIPERFTSYNKRVNAEYVNGDQTKRAELEKLAQETADRITVDPAPQRVSAIAKGDLLKAEDVLSGTPDSIEEKVQKYLNVVRDFELVRDDSNIPEKQSLARLIGKYVDAVL
jgi:hypothetical protein